MTGHIGYGLFLAWNPFSTFTGEDGLSITHYRHGIADTIHFIEVKTRRAGGWTTPEQAISPAKCRALFRGAEAFLAMSGTKLEPQFDLMAVDMFDENDCDIRYIENAMQSHW